MSDLHELRIERHIAAPVDVVWRAWVDHQAEWFCPRPWRASVEVSELRPGGRSVVVMHGPAGEEMRHEGVYLEVVTGERIVSTDAFTAGWRPAGPFLVRIDEFAADGAGTRYAAVARHWTAEARDQHAAMGFEAGWGAAADQLEEVVRRLVAGG
ncbi:Uncharacterized conserved protein YndB, AHSA1/START domain [Sphingomonas guangdongensis]|uniref:Uncharacterized conserved protein YndB, AHSA1/START domain n=1 Tax=Sphingomonas guangdongensis TaxID=1141890 RepID=A0A285QGE0_9SPHN|nr:SRPBCC family protein [Sphingomonas guangdongensis]SOB80891.1 Uncharacterized conserved protein YndB, AHSA1/START domain [Sphingomonas guangdongensis]